VVVTGDVDAAIDETGVTTGPEVVILTNETYGLSFVVGLDVLSKDFALDLVRSLETK